MKVLACFSSLRRRSGALSDELLAATGVASMDSDVPPTPLAGGGGGRGSGFGGGGAEEAEVRRREGGRGCCGADGFLSLRSSRPCSRRATLQYASAQGKLLG